MSVQAVSSPPEHRYPLGRIVSVSGSQAIVLMHSPDLDAGEPVMSVEMGTLLKVETQGSIVLGLVSALTVPMPSQDPTEPEMRIIELEFAGELPLDKSGMPQAFRRGISSYPGLGHEVFQVSNDILAMAYACEETSGVKIGTIVQEPSIPAIVRTDELLGKHFAVLGATGSGKSCSVTLILRNILKKTPNAHVVLLDPHREYASAFGDKAEVVNSENLHLPFWLLTFEEIIEILIGNQPGREADIEALRELIPLAKARYGMNQRRGDTRSVVLKNDRENFAPSVDTPVPYRISDLLALLNESMAKLDLRGELAPFKRVKSRIETISRDPRYAFMFGSLTVQDTMAGVLSRIFRIPVNGKPITIVELAALPSEIINVVVSVLSRMTFDFALWGNGQVPITLVCEEAHRYVPAVSPNGLESAKRALGRIAKEGRKYGVSLCIISQRPGELDPTILSQCATMFCMRLSNEHDQEIVRVRVSDGSASLLDVLPSLGIREAVAFGEGVALPTRIRFDLLPQEAMPRCTTASFSEDWQSEIGDTNFVHNVVARWRTQSLKSDSDAHGQSPADIAHEPRAYDDHLSLDEHPANLSEMPTEQLPAPPAYSPGSAYYDTAEPPSDFITYEDPQQAPPTVSADAFTFEDPVVEPEQLPTITVELEPLTKPDAAMSAIEKARAVLAGLAASKSSEARAQAAAEEAELREQTKSRIRALGIRPPQ